MAATKTFWHQKWKWKWRHFFSAANAAMSRVPFSVWYVKVATILDTVIVFAIKMANSTPKLVLEWHNQEEWLSMSEFWHDDTSQRSEWTRPLQRSPQFAVGQCRHIQQFSVESGISCVCTVNVVYGNTCQWAKDGQRLSQSAPFKTIECVAVLRNSCTV